MFAGSKIYSYLYTSFKIDNVYRTGIVTYKGKGRFRRVCYLAVSLFANDGDEEVEGRHAPTTIKSTAIAF